MVMKLLTSLFGSKNEREIKRLQPIVDQINQLEPQIQALSDDALKNQTAKLKEAVANGADLDSLLPEALPRFGKLLCVHCRCAISTARWSVA